LAFPNIDLYGLIERAAILARLQSSIRRIDACAAICRAFSSVSLTVVNPSL